MKRLFSPIYYNFSLLSASFLALSSLFPFQAAARGDSEEFSSDNRTHFAAIIKIDSDDALEQLRQSGVEILRQRDNLLLCFVPLNEHNGADTRSGLTLKSDPVKTLSYHIKEIKGISKVERARSVSRSMDKAREWFEAENLHTGEGFDMPYTGKGVVTGICDIGIDPLHISFLNEEGEPRIKRIVQYKEGLGQRIVLSPDDYAEWGTDTPDNWHASHVANIMAGSYGQYRGMAPESDIVITTSQLTDVGLLCGAEDILDYARQNDKRAVINMSMANYIGPHDGSSLFCQYLDKIAEEAIVVLSAGNAGDTPLSLPFDFSETDQTAGLMLYSSDWVQFDPYGAVDVWSLDQTPLKVRFGIRDTQEFKIVKMFPWQQLYDDSSFTVTSDPARTPASDKETVIYDEDFASIYSGWFSLTGGFDSENGRYRTIMEYDAHTDIEVFNGHWARYVPVIEVAGDPGAHADIYADYQFTNFRALHSAVQPSSVLSFSDLATGENVISVGMFVNRDRRPSISGEEYYNDFVPGTVFKASSYSTLNDGRVMPLTVAPGFGVVSAMSSYYMKAHPDGQEQINAEVIADGKRYLWATNHGTSMSSPYVAGTIACWLQALPELSSRDVMQIIAESNIHDYPEPENPRHGQGWLDPVEGLKTALKNFSGIDKIEDSNFSEIDDTRKLTFSNNTLCFWNPEGADSSISVYDSAGLNCFTASSSSPVESFSLSLPPGLYIAKIQGSNITIKFLIR